MKFLASWLRTSPAQVFKWSLMLTAVFWTLVFKLSELGIKVPDFVYANF